MLSSLQGKKWKVAVLNENWQLEVIARLNALQIFWGNASYTDVGP